MKTTNDCYLELVHTIGWAYTSDVMYIIIHNVYVNVYTYAPTCTCTYMYVPACTCTCRCSTYMYIVSTKITKQNL